MSPQVRLDFFRFDTPSACGGELHFKNGNYRVVTPDLDDLSKFIVKAEKEGEAFLIDNINHSKVLDYKGIKKLISEKLK